MSNMIEIVTAVSDNYSQHLGVMLTSLTSNTGRSVRVHVLSSFISEKNKMRIRKTVREKDQVIFHHVDKKLFTGFFVKGLAIEAYFRFLIPQYLTQYKKVLYLDSDIIVSGDIGELYDCDLGDEVIAAVSDPGITKDFSLKLSGKESYFNSGVLLFDLSKLNEGNTIQWMDFALQNQQKITWHDQCVLNYYLPFKRLSPRFNFMANFFHNSTIKNSEYSFSEIREAQKSIVVLHFNALLGKPWEMRCSHPLRFVYVQALIKSPWRKSALRLILAQWIWNMYQRVKYAKRSRL